MSTPPNWRASPSFTCWPRCGGGAAVPCATTCEQVRIDDWLARIRKSAADYELAVEIAQCQRLIKGYGDTHERGLSRFAAIMQFLDQAPGGPELAAQVRRLRSAALADEDGQELDSALRKLAAA